MSVTTGVEIIIQMPSESGGGNGNTINGGTPSPANVQQEGKPQENPVNGDKNSQAKLATAVQVAKNVGGQALNAAVSNIGLATGNYYKQQEVQQGLQAVNTVAGLVMAASNPITFGVALAGLAISAGSEMYQQRKQMQNENYVAAQNARRLGFTEARK
jgi:hypothetical protein